MNLGLFQKKKKSVFFKKIIISKGDFFIFLQGPVLSGHKQLVAKKLAEEEAERKVKGEAKKEKHMVFSLKLY